jgi:hypothetical protein
MLKTPRRAILLLIGVVAALAIAIPAFGASPAPSATPPTQHEPAESAKPHKSAKPDKAPEVAVTAHGTVTQATDGQGRPTFTLTDGATTWDLSDGPPWFWGEKNPLAAYVGKSVTVVGSSETGTTELEVDTVDGKAIRAAGKPPWAGGPWVVGPTHPGWKPWMANGKPGKGNGSAPGKTKDDATGS